MVAGPQSKQSSQPQVGCLVLAAIGVVVLLVSQCDGKSPGNDASLMTSSTQAPPVEPTSNEIATSTAPPPLTDLKPSDLKSGTAAFAKARAIGDASSAAVYSKNCYKALAEHFSWGKLDQCGTFDAAAAEFVLDDLLPGEGTDLGYFDSEVAAGRYLDMGAHNGADPGAMDERLAKIGAAASVAARKASAALVVTPKFDGNAGADDQDRDGVDETSTNDGE